VLALGRGDTDAWDEAGEVVGSDKLAELGIVECVLNVIPELFSLSLGAVVPEVAWDWLDESLEVDASGLAVIVLSQDTVINDPSVKLIAF
jgi:hypothetical protein